MSKYKVGDKVKIRSWGDMEAEYGTDCMGYIMIPRYFAPRMKQYCGKVMTITDIRKHTSGKELIYTLDGVYDWKFSEEMFEKSKPVIIIYQNGREVIALNKATGEKGVAICSPEDKFDFNTGANLAYERLRGRKTPPKASEDKKFFTGEIVCVEEGGSFTEGKIYEVKNGLLYGDRGFRVSDIESVTHLNNRLASKFIAIVR